MSRKFVFLQKPTDIIRKTGTDEEDILAVIDLEIGGGLQADGGSEHLVF